MTDTRDPGNLRSADPPGNLPVQVEAVYAEESARVSLLRMATVLLRHRGLVVGIPLGLTALLLAVALALPARYSATASFMPQDGSASSSRLAGLASQLGFSLPTGDASESPEFYAALLGSREVLRAAAQTRYRSGGEATETSTLVDLLGARGDPEERLAEAMEWLQDAVRVTTSETTGLVQVSVRSRSPRLSAGLAERLIELVNEFNLDTRQTRAAREREFVAARLEEAAADLRRAEDDLQQFLQRNRRVEHSPELTFERDRLQRAVALQQEVYTTLAQAHEQARIEEVRDTPVITVVEPAMEPLRPDSRQLPALGLLGLFVGGILGVAAAALKELLGGLRAHESDEYREFTELRKRSMAELKGGWRRLARRGD